MRLVNGFTIVWRFTIHPESKVRFESIYGPNGAWAVLFARSAGYRGTELLRGTSDPNSYLTIDRWESEAAFEEFRRQFAAEYEALDRQCEGLTQTEAKIGIFERRD
jgi:heme-degrading monooxygenase HmoA